MAFVEWAYFFFVGIMYGFYRRFLESVEKYPNSTAVELQATAGALNRYSYAEMRQMTESVGRWLCDSGIPVGERCAILAANGPLWVVSYLGIMASGTVAVPLDTAFNHDQVKKLLRDSGSLILFTDLHHLSVAEKAIEGTQIRIVILDGSGQGHADLRTILSARRTGEFRPANVDDNDLALIMYTSGTTSDPKGVMLTHKNLLAEAEAIFSAIPVSQSDSVLAVLPLFHVMPQVANLLLPFSKGMRIVYLESLASAELLRALRERGITVFCCVPQFFYLIHDRIFQEIAKQSWPARTVFRLLMGLSAAGRKVKVNLGKLFFRKVHALFGPQMRYFITGGSAFDARVGRDLQTLGFTILQSYGLTETTAAATSTSPERNVLGSVGTSLKGVHVKVVDPQPIENLRYPVGEIAIAGDTVMKGYYNRPDATAETIRDGWLLSGDLGYLDREGNIFITGRKKEVIVLSSGKNVYPEEIEAHYLRTPLIKELCVMGLMNRPGEPVSERLHAVIVPNFDVLRDRKIVNARAVIKYDVENLSAELPATKRMLSYDIWPEALPRTSTRKLKRFEIQRRVVAAQAERAGDPTTPTEEPSAEEAIWLTRPEVQQAIAIIRRASRRDKPVLPSHNLELDLGLDSTERVEVLMDLEHELAAKIDDQIVSRIYTVRELIDALLQARNPSSSSTAASPGWGMILKSELDDPRTLVVMEKTPRALFFWFMLSKMVSLFSYTFCSLRVSGREKLPLKGPFILCPNHQSFLDAPVILSQIPWRLFKDMFFVGTSEMFGEGPFAHLARSLKVVPIDPDSNLVSAMRAGALGLRNGKILLLYPEGSRTIDGTPKTFKKGAAILSMHLRVPIYPVALEGFYKAWPRHKTFPRLTKLRMKFGDPIYPPESSNNIEETYVELTEQLHANVAAMWDHLRQQDSWG